MVFIIIAIQLFIILISNIIGGFILQTLKIKDVLALPVGFAALLAVGQIVFFPLMVVNIPFQYSYTIFCLVIGGIVILGIHCFVRNNEHRSIITDIEEKINEYVKKIDMYYCMAGIIVFTQIIIAMISQNGGTDDSYYYSISTTILESDAFSPYDPTTGNAVFSLFAQNRFVGFEVLIAVLSKLFGINVSIIAHSVIGGVHLVVCFSIIHEICRVIFPQKTSIVFMFAVLWRIFGEFSSLNFANALMSPHVGKTILHYFFIPFSFLLFYRVYNKKAFEYNDVILTTIASWAGICSSSRGIFLVPLSYAVYCLTLFLYLRSIRYIIKCSIPMITLLPYVIIKYMTLKNSSDFETITTLKKVIDLSTIYKELAESGVMSAFLVASFIILIVLGNRVIRYIIGVHTVLCLLTVANPLLIDIVQKYVTGAGNVYLSIYFIYNIFCWPIIAFGLLIIHFKSKSVSTILFAIIFGLLAVHGVYLFKSGVRKIEIAKNWEKLDPASIAIADALIEIEDEYPNLMLPTNYIDNPYTYQIRQYTGKIRLVWSHYMKRLYFSVGDYEGYDQLIEIYQKVYGAGLIDEETIDIIKAKNIDYIGVIDSKEKEFLSYNYPCVYQNERIAVYFIGESEKDVGMIMPVDQLDKSSGSNQDYEK